MSEEALLAASRFIERKLGRFFTKDASDATRVYMGSGYDKLYVDDLVSVTTIKIDEDDDGSFSDETALASTDYELLPRNAGDGPEPAAYNCIALTSYGTQGVWPTRRRVEVVGVFGWPSVPAPIKQACIKIASILEAKGPWANNRINDMGDVLELSRSAQNIIWDLMREYRKVSF